MNWSLCGFTRNPPARARKPSASVQSAKMRAAQAPAKRGAQIGARAMPLAELRDVRDDLSVFARSASKAVEAEEERARCDFKSGKPESRGDGEYCGLSRIGEPCCGK